MSRMKIISFIAIILIAVGVVGSTVSYRFIDKSEEVKEDTFDAKSISVIDITSDNAEIEVIPVAGDSEIKVELKRPDNWKGKYNTRVKGDTLSIGVN